LESLKINIPRYFISQYIGEYDLGIFAPIAYLKQVGNIFAIALGLSACPRLAKYYAAEENDRYRNLLVILVGIGVLIGLSGVVVSATMGKPLLSLLYDPQYAEHDNLLIIMMVAAGFDYVATFLDYGMTSARYFKPQLPLFLCVTGVSAVASIFLIPKYGLRGAAIAVVLSSFVRLVGSFLIIFHILRQRYRSSHEEEPRP
jgi:O-antigen/teichoic acid export membrane protein